MKATFKITLNELDVNLIEKLKNIFSKDNVIEISISEETDETGYLLSTKANRESLYRSLEQLKKGELIVKSVNEIPLH